MWYRSNKVRLSIKNKAVYCMNTKQRQNVRDTVTIGVVITVTKIVFSQLLLKHGIGNNFETILIFSMSVDRKFYKV